MLNRTLQLSFFFFALLLAAPRFAVGLDIPVRGDSLVVRNPNPSDSSGRRITFLARSDPGGSILGDPASPGSGVLLTVSLDGAHQQRQSFFLAQGSDDRAKPFWRGVTQDEFFYSDRRGSQGPVRSLLLRRTTGGKVKIRARLSGGVHPLHLTPPAPGTGASVTVEVSSGARYCALFGVDSVVRNSRDRRFRISRPAAQGCPDENAAGELLVLAYNVAGLPEALSSSEPAINTPLIAPLLNLYDLVLMQESWLTPDPNPLAPLRTYHEILEAGSELPFRSVPRQAPLGTDPTRPSALLADGLNRFSRLPFGPVTRVRWLNCHTSAGDCLAQKGFSYARTTFAPGVEVDVYNLHMEAGGAPEDDVIRAAGVSQLIDAMATFSAGRAVILGGDFNLHIDEEPDATVYQRLLDDAGLTDVCSALDCPEPNRIDKFAFRSGGGISLAPRSWNFETEIFERFDGQPLSDHDPLAVRFAWERQ